MQISANGISLEVDDRGPPGAEPLVMIMGLGMQLVAWPDGLVDLLVGQGFRVIRFDNRDMGLSQRFDHLGVPNVAAGALRHTLGLSVDSPYRLSDLADDTAALIAALGLDSAHVCGASMGGMVAQHLAARHPQRVRSLTLMMTTSGARHLPQPGWKVRMALMSRPADARHVDRIVDHFMHIYGVIGSPGFPSDPAGLRERLAMSVKRAYRPAATARQLMAILADGDRTSLLGAIRQPTTVIHGLADPLVPPEAGRDLARRIAGASLDLVEGMGHDLPEALWPRFAQQIARVAGLG
ncbi:alpha/beta fold hydrolase [uncultured Piscinibacter sp.]|uniref:alpha/beta fold hydrolase n=1 Tax=uncultured Piscinibacter sp. TaxID=1131835 RepID=UPI002625F871|nr:alpha/beta fold hydrolase [uncultured Piscinibacter sp.]